MNPSHWVSSYLYWVRILLASKVGTPNTHAVSNRDGIRAPGESVQAVLWARRCRSVR